jgi:hypothetical protein
VVLDGFAPEMEPDAQSNVTYWQQWSSGWGQRRLTVPLLVNITPLPSPTSPCFFHKFIISFFILPPRDPPLQIFGHREKEKMASRSPPPSKRGRREDDDDESSRRKKLEKRKEPTTKDADEERSSTTLSSPSTYSGAPSESLKMLARPSTSRRIMTCTRTRA